MKNKIKRFAKGDFHIPQPEIIFPETRIIMRVGEGEEYRGSFSLQNEGEGTIRGLVYPSSFRVHCDEQGFDGNPVNIYYTYDGTGLDVYKRQQMPCTKNQANCIRNTPCQCPAYLTQCFCCHFQPEVFTPPFGRHFVS